MSRRRRITSKGLELIKKRSYYDRKTLRSCRPKFSRKGFRKNTNCLLRRSKSKRRSKKSKRNSKRDGMDEVDEATVKAKIIYDYNPRSKRRILIQPRPSRPSRPSASAAPRSTSSCSKARSPSSALFMMSPAAR